MKSSFVIAVVLGIIITQSPGDCAWFRCPKNVAGFFCYGCFAQICSSNPSNQKRGCDDQGCGHFGASRTSKPVTGHLGIDIECDAGSKIYPPFPATVIGPRRPYKDNPELPHNRGIHLQGRGIWAGYKVKLFYIRKTVNAGDSVETNTVIGSMTDMTDGDRGMTNHVHVQLEYADDDSVVNPKPFIC